MEIREPTHTGCGNQKSWRRIGIEDSPLFDPGTEFDYSNTNYVLLGLVLEQVTGKPIGELYRQRIIEPLGLKRHLLPRPRGYLPSRAARPGLHPPRPILRRGAQGRYRLERLLDMDGRHDDLDGR